MGFPISLDQEQYEALVSLARKGATGGSGSDPRDLEAFLNSIEEANGIKRSFVVIQWQELNNSLPPTTQFPDKWPPEQRGRLELISRPVARVDVEKYVAAHAKNPHNILVTRDPAGIIGWSTLDHFFIT